jgi:hypothetical protein
MHPSDLLAQEQQVVVPYTLADRDRAIRTEERLNGLESDMKELKNNVNRLEEKFNKYFMWEFGLVLVAIFGLVGFIIYDRRIVLAPLESKTNRIINVLKDAGDQNPTIKDSLKKNTIL